MTEYDITINSFLKNTELSMYSSVYGDANVYLSPMSLKDSNR